MSGPLLVGVDVGTQSAKAAVFELSGVCLAEAAVPLRLHRRGADEVEQEPEDFYQAATAAIASCAAASGRPGDVAGVAVAGQMAGVLGIGADGRAVTPYDSWLDSRCRREVEMIAARLGDRLVELSGCPPMVAHAPKIAWWRRHRPETYAKVATLRGPGRLRGRPAVRPGRHRGLRRHHLPALQRAGRHGPGHLVARAGRRVRGGAGTRCPASWPRPRSSGGSAPPPPADCGLLPGTPVAAGLGDTAAGALGAGIVAPGQLLDTAGTASVLALSTTAFRPDLSGTLVQMRGAVPGQWLALAYLAGGDLLRWLPEVLGAASLEVLVEEASGCGGARLLFVPHLGGPHPARRPRRPGGLGRPRPLPDPGRPGPGRPGERGLRVRRVLGRGPPALPRRRPR